MRFEKKHKKIILSCLMLVFLASICCGFTTKVFAQETQNDEYFIGYELTGNLYNETNTFLYDADSETCNVSTSGIIPNAQVSEEAPLITVLTHGLGGNASHWSNNGEEFAPDTSSIISKLNERYKQASGQDANIYWAKVTEEKQFYLIPLIQDNIENGAYRSSGNTVRYINDISKHIIIVFEAFNTNAVNKKVYNELNYVLSKIIYDVKCLNDGVLPKINLIGHSRGGITNLQYALDHPQLVHSMFAIGTPFFGSSSASTFLGEQFATGEGRQDIISRETYVGYYNRWINGKDDYYSNIKAYAIGGYSDTDFMFQRLIESAGFYEISDEGLTFLKNFLRYGKISGTIITTAASLANNLMAYVRNDAYKESELEALLVEILSEIEYQWPSDFLDATVEFFCRKQSPIFKNDVLVHLSSQLGQDEYSNVYRDYGFKKFKKNFTESNCNLTKKAVASSPAVVHNLETRDKDIINYIVSRTEMDGLNDNSNFYYVINENNQAVITGMRVATPGNTIEIPESIHDKTVVEIGYGAFIGETMQELILASTVQRISPFAFAENDDLTTVSYDENSSLSAIGLGAFANCSSLNKFGTINTKLIFPNNMQTVDPFAFSGTAFLSVWINANMSNISYGAFAFCPNLAKFQMNSHDGSIRVINDVLYKNDGTLIAYPTAKTNNIFSTEDVTQFTVTQIQDFAFANNINLTSIEGEEVLSIGGFAFLGCENLDTIIFPNVEILENSAMEGTAIDYTDDEFEILGKTLFKYNGNASIITKEDLHGIVAVNVSAFQDNSYIEKVDLPYTVERISNFAFNGCSNLSILQIEKNSLPMIYGNTFFGTPENFKVYCQKNIIDSLTLVDGEWYSNKEILQPITTKAHFLDTEQVVDFYFGSQISIPEYNVPDKITLGWNECEQNGSIINDNYLSDSIWDKTAEEVYYKADLQDIMLYQLYFKNGDVDIGSVTISTGDNYSFNKTTYLLNGTSYNYTQNNLMSNYAFGGHSGLAVNNGVTVANFLGWFIGEEPLTSGTWTNSYSSSVIYVNAVWEFVPFTLTLIDEINGNTEQIVYNYSVVELESFDEINDMRFINWIDSNGNTFVQITNFTHDITLTALWKEVYTVSFVSNEHTVQTIIRRGILGEMIIVPGLSSQTHTVSSWGTHIVGQEYIIYGNETLTAFWTPRDFIINYRNITFNNDNALLLQGNNVNNPAPSCYTYGQGLGLSDIIAFFYHEHSTAPKLVFIGWYNNMDFTTKVNSISTTQYGEVTLYAKWRYDYGYGAREGSQTVTNQSPLNQDFILINLGLANNNLYQNLLDIGIRKLIISLKIDIQPGFLNYGQEVYLYGGEDGSILLKTYNLLGANDRVETINMEVDLETLGANSFVIVRFGSPSMSWANNGMFYGVSYCVVATDKDSPEFTWSNNDPF